MSVFLFFHFQFTFGKVWLLYAQFEIRQNDLKAARQALVSVMGDFIIWMDRAGGRSLAQKWVRRKPFADQIVLILVSSRFILKCSSARQVLSQCLSEPRGMIGYRRTVWENLTRVLGAKLTAVDNT